MSSVVRPRTPATSNPASTSSRTDEFAGLGVVAAVALVFLGLHLACLTQFGIFRDELYYVACARHLAWGYVDQPPLSIAILALALRLPVDPLVAMRLLSALAGAGTVFVTGLIARRFGGGAYAMGLAAVSAAVAPVVLVVSHFYSMNVFDLLIWALVFLQFARTLEAPSNPRWALLGLLLGLGLLNKISVLWLIAGMALGLTLPMYRRLWLTPGPWIAAALALVLFAPHLIWEAGAGFPTTEFMRNATEFKMASVSPTAFIALQLLALNPLSAPLWIGGLLYLLFSRDAARWRPFGIVYLVVFALLIVSGKSRPNYLAAAYPPLFAAGAVALEHAALRRWAVAFRVLAVLAPAALGLAILPASLPILPPTDTVRYLARIGLKVPNSERGKTSPLPQYFADMFGWKELAQTVAEVFDSLPPPLRARCAIFGGNYGEAGAIDYFGPAMGLPHAISGHNNYWLWGPGGWDGRTAIVINGNKSELERAFRSVRLAGVARSPFGMPFENRAPIYVVEGPRLPLRTIWARAKRFL